MVKLSKICKCVMASLVVESLFTIISLEETIENFIFGNSLYRQIDGVAMGSPLGPTLANAFSCYYEKG